MGANNLVKRIDDVSVLMYQNKQREAFEEVAALLKDIQEMGQSLLEKSSDIPETFIASTIQELIEMYQKKDLLGMADCLQQKVLLMAELAEKI